MRTYRNSTPPEITLKEQKEKVSTIKREYTLITPLFGGGAEPAERDLVTTIRATEIRGQLRFWWRACRAAKYETIEELKAAEDAIWGKAHKKGDKDSLKYYQTVQIVVEVADKDRGEPEEPYPISDKDRYGNPKYTAPIDRSKNIPGYAAFPLQPTQQELDKNRPPNGPKPIVRQVYENIRFTLVIVFPEQYEADIEAALWAWQNFGGIGARTRRGFGALSLSRPAEADLPASTSKNVVASWLNKQLALHVVDGKPPRGVPYLSKQVSFRVATVDGSAKGAWRRLIDKLSGFRQTPVGRTGNGGSHWPEAKAIRYLTASRVNQREENRPPLLKFPRAAFGLPIVFHFPGELVDKRVPTLQGAEKTNERLASPLILRPLLCRDNRAVGLALLLDGYQLPMGKIVLKEKDTPGKDGSNVEGKKYEVEAKLTKEDVSVLRDRGLDIRQEDILQAFMDYLER